VEGAVRWRGARPFQVERVEPPDGATGTLRDDPVLLRLSAPIDVDRFAEATVEVREAETPVPSRIETLDGGRVLVWWPECLLSPGREHRVVVRGLRDRLGREAPPHASRFTPGPVAAHELRW
jgi:hypothetical protein